MNAVNDTIGLAVGDLMRETNAPRHRVMYALTRAGIRPKGRLGNTDIYDRAALARLRQSLAETAARHTAGHGVMMA